MKIISWNVNGIRSVHTKGFANWVESVSPDILCLQETRAEIDQFPEEILEWGAFELHHSSAQKKGYAGVASFSLEKTIRTEKSQIDHYDNEGRVLIHEYQDFYLLNCYFPNGQRDHKRVPFKMKFCEEIHQKINQLQKHKPVIICGDFNTAHNEIDLANPKSNKNTTGFLEIEREWMNQFTKEGWIDIYRHLNPTNSGAYTWWSNMFNCRQKNIGWRIDYFFISPSLLPRVKNAEILSHVMGSDHCPILLEIE
jgi:exodeoxyribonuclease-3